MLANIGMLATRRPSLVYAHNDRDPVNKSVFTFSGCNYGAVDPTRFLIIMAMLGGGSITSVTVDSVAPTLLATRDNFNTGGNTQLKIYVIAKPALTSGTIVVSGNSSPLGAAVAVHSAYNCNITPKASGVKANGSTAAFPGLTLAGNDVALFTDGGGSTNVSFSGATQTVNDQVNGTSCKYGTAILQASASGVYNVSSNYTGNNWPYYLVFGK